MSNQLEKILQESGLETIKAQILLDQFRDCSEIAADWEEKAKALVVTDASQVVEIEMAWGGWMILRDMRLRIEKTRKRLKEESLREGQAIDGIARFLKDLIVPIEEHLEKQGKFVELKEKAEKEAHQREVERRMEEERLAAEKAAREESDRVRAENEKLKKEAVERERAVEKERKAAQAEADKKLKEQRDKADAVVLKMREDAQRDREALLAKQAVTKAELKAEKKETKAVLTDFQKLLEFVRKVAEWEDEMIRARDEDAISLYKLREAAKELYKSIIYQKEKTSA